jgi:hypothetical protein
LLYLVKAAQTKTHQIRTLQNNVRGFEGTEFRNWQSQPTITSYRGPGGVEWFTIIGKS